MHWQEENKPDTIRYTQARRYMIDRCCYAAAIFFFSQNGGVRRDPLTMRRLMVRWSEVELEEFFRDLMASLQRNEPLGGLLLHNTRQGPMHHAGTRPPEEERLLSTLRYLDERVQLRMQALKPLDAARDVVCDASPYEALRDEDCKESVGLVSRILLSRRGALTCPVRTGVVFVALCDPQWLRYMGSEATGRKMLEAARSAVSARFEGLTAAEVVERSEKLRTLPRILVTDECYAGLTHEFDLRDEEWGTEEIWAGRRDPPEFAEFSRPNPDAAEGARCHDEGVEEKVWLFANYAIRLRPLLWFQFHTLDEASRFMGGVEHRQQCLRYRGPAKPRGYLGTQNQIAILAPLGMVPAAEGGSHADRSRARSAASSGVSQAAAGSASGVQARGGEEETGAAGVDPPRALQGSAEVRDAEVCLRETASMASSDRSDSLGDAQSDEESPASSREGHQSMGSDSPNMNAEREAISSGGEGDSESLGSESEDLDFDDDEDYDDEDFEDEDSEDEGSENEDFQDFVEQFEDHVEIDYDMDALSQTSGSSHSFDDEDMVMDRMDGVLDLEGHSLSKTHRRNRCDADESGIWGEQFGAPRCAPISSTLLLQAVHGTSSASGGQPCNGKAH